MDRGCAAQAKFRDVTMELAVKHWQRTLELLAEIKAYRVPPDNMLRLVVALLVSVQVRTLTTMTVLVKHGPFLALFEST